ncbi:MAG: TraR/DksA C4-type zinc finger protein [Nitrospirota bacterium]|nr:TraR/DksA C4-type zinc finger protein [Nitrospirota bacterium]
MAAASTRKSAQKKTAVRKNAVKSISGRTAKSAGKAKKDVAARKTAGKIPAAPKTAAKKTPVKKTVPPKAGGPKTAAPKSAGVRKPQQKAKTSQDRLLELRKSLLRKKEDILKEAKEEISKYISGENKQLVDTALDDGDWAVVDISEDISLLRLSSHRKLMHGIDEAIRKIAEGTYGICEECNEEISEKRLLVLPAATLCIDCQEHKEQFEAFSAVSEE